MNQHKTVEKNVLAGRLGKHIKQLTNYVFSNMLQNGLTREKNELNAW